MGELLPGEHELQDYLLIDKLAKINNLITEAMYERNAKRRNHYLLDALNIIHFRGLVSYIEDDGTQVYETPTYELDGDVGQ